MGAVLVALALAAGLSGCTPGEPEAAPGVPVSDEASASASPVDPAEAAKQERIAAAQKRFEEYIEITNRYSKKGEDPFWELMNSGYLGNPDIQNLEKQVGEQFTTKKLKQVGDTVVVSYRNPKYEGDPRERDVTGHRVKMGVCVDNSDMDWVDADGNSVLNEDFPRKVVIQIVMQGQPAGNWSVVKNDNDGKEC